MFAYDVLDTLLNEDQLRDGINTPPPATIPTNTPNATTSAQSSATSFSKAATRTSPSPAVASPSPSVSPPTSPSITSLALLAEGALTNAGIPVNANGNGALALKRSSDGTKNGRTKAQKLWKVTSPDQISEQLKEKSQRSGSRSRSPSPSTSPTSRRKRSPGRKSPGAENKAIPSLPLPINLINQMNDNQPVTIPVISHPMPSMSKSPRNSIVQAATAQPVPSITSPRNQTTPVQSLIDTISKLDPGTRNMMKESFERLAKRAESSAAADPTSPESDDPNSIAVVDSYLDGPLKSSQPAEQSSEIEKSLEQKVMNMLLTVPSPLSSPRDHLTNSSSDVTTVSTGSAPYSSPSPSPRNSISGPPGPTMRQGSPNSIPVAAMPGAPTSSNGTTHPLHLNLTGLQNGGVQSPYPMMGDIPAAYVFTPAPYMNPSSWWVGIGAKGGTPPRVINSSLYPYMINAGNRTVLLPNTGLDAGVPAYFSASYAPRPDGRPAAVLPPYYNPPAQPKSPSKSRRSPSISRRRKSKEGESLSASADSIPSPRTTIPSPRGVVSGSRSPRSPRSPRERSNSLSSANTKTAPAPSPMPTSTQTPTSVPQTTYLMPNPQPTLFPTTASPQAEQAFFGDQGTISIDMLDADVFSPNPEEEQTLTLF